MKYTLVFHSLISLMFLYPHIQPESKIEMPASFSSSSVKHSSHLEESLSRFSKPEQMSEPDLFSSLNMKHCTAAQPST